MHHPRRVGGGRRERQPVWSNYALCRLGTRTACGDAQGAGLALAGPLREAWRRPWGPPHGGDELTDAPAEEFLELDGGRVHLLRGGRTAAASGPGYLVRPGCRATGPGLTGSSLASQGLWRRLRRSAKRPARGHRGHHARIDAVGRLPSRAKSNVSAGEVMWGGWGSNPRPADYEKYGPMHHAR